MIATAEPPVTMPGAADAAHAAIADAARHLRRARRRFLEREDAESLHGIRVALRRLRAVLTLFRPSLDLPRRLDDRAIRRIGHDLADLRDLDVAHQAIMAIPLEHADASQRLRRLERRRRRELHRVIERLRSARMRRVLRSLRRWDRSPGFLVDEETPVSVVLRGLRSRVAAIELHPAWSLTLVATEDGSLRAPDGVYDDDTTADLLHQLRRRIKQVRYQVDVAARTIAADWATTTDHLRQLQETLGVIQDAHMLGDLASLPVERVADACDQWEMLRGERLRVVRDALETLP